MLTCVKYIVVIYNLIFWFLGVLLLALSIFLFLDVRNYTDFEDAESSSLIIAPFIVLMVIGAIMTIVGFLGCCGAICESRCLLAMYFICCIGMCVACSAAIFWATTHSQEVKDRLQRDYKQIVQKHYKTGPLGASDLIVDQIQTDFKCCGASGPSDWATSRYSSDRDGTVDVGVAGGFSLSGAGIPGTYRVPASCCEPGYEECSAEGLTINSGGMSFNLEAVKDRIMGVYSDGCIEKLTEFIDEKWKLLIIIGFILVGVQFFALLFACILCCAISRSEDK